MEAVTDDNGTFCSIAFKLWSDPFVGKLVFFRVYSGTLSKGDTVYNPRTNKRERISRWIQIQADKREDIETCYSGDIAAIVGIKNITTGDTLCDEDYPILLEPPTFPDPVISMAIEPKTKLDQEKMGVALQRLAEEDPTFRVYTHEDTGQTIIAGMGELHLEIIRDRMFREFKVDANAGKPQIAYRETITGGAHGVGKLIKQSGGRGQYGHVEVDVRSEEHTSELQSRLHLVCRLLLEKKKTKQIRAGPYRRLSTVSDSRLGRSCAAVRPRPRCLSTSIRSEARALALSSPIAHRQLQPR